MSDNKKDAKAFNPTLVGVYKTKNGHWSPPLNSDNYDRVMKHVEQGGRFVVKDNKFKKNDKSPDAFLEFIPRVKVEEMDAEFRSRQNKKENDEIDL